MPGETAAKLRRQVSRNRTRTRSASSSSPSAATASAPSPASTTAFSHGSGYHDRSQADSQLPSALCLEVDRVAASVTIGSAMTRIVASYDGVHCSASSRLRRSRRTSHGRTTDSPPLSPVRLFLSDDRTAIHLVSHDESDFGIGASGSRLDLLIRYELMRSKPGVKHDEDLLP